LHIFVFVRNEDVFKNLPPTLKKLKKAMFITMPDFSVEGASLSSTSLSSSLAFVGREKRLLLDQSPTLSFYYPGTFILVT
jgi:hypothetical protein